MLPGYLTAMKLRGTQSAERVEQAWEYDARGNVRYLWRGDVSRTGPGATEVWELQYDNPQGPTVVTVIDPLGDPSEYTLDRTDRARPRITRIDGPCPGCGLGGTTVFTYGDPDHPLRPTEMVDGEGNRTVYTYDSNGMRTSVTEAVGTPEQRLTLWDYDPNFPAFMARQEEVGVQAGVPRVTSWIYDPSKGDLESTTIEGWEATIAGGPQFGLTTTYAYHPGSGALEASDPPGYGTADAAAFTYDAARGNLVPLERADPLIGVTSFEHDARNRRTAEIDPNGTRTETAYDELDRVRFVRVCNVATPSAGCGPTGTLVTEHQYDAFGDLVRTTLPRGNMIEYGYDGMGRMIRTERKPDAGTNGERVVYTLDAAGNRTLERLERWAGSAWVLDGQTETVYRSRCHVLRTVLGKGSPTESVTEYEYDCNGNLVKAWDANHPRTVPSTPASSEYSYDALDRLAQMRQPWGGAGGGVVTTGYLYDAQDHLTRATDGEGGVTQYQSSDRDLVTRETSEVSGTTTHRYNEHGQIDRTTDARGIVTTRTIDALDRVTLVSYPDTEKEVKYTYDDPLVPFSLGQLTRIERGRIGVDSTYDGFGRVLRDGGLVYALDANGNRSTVTYPGGVVATYSYDFADRPLGATLQWSEGGGTSMATVASGAHYAAFGPLRGLTLGNGLVEERSHDQRYFPDRIRVLNGASTVFDWDYAVDFVGNPMRIDEASSPGSLHQPAVPRVYGYQDLQYYLTRGDGPWGALDWTYDRIGNRLSEQRDGGAVEAYEYRGNAAGGNTAMLETVNVNRVYTFGPAGHLDQVNAAGNVIAFDHDDEGRLGGMARQLGESVTADYDGRGFLAEIGGLGSSGLFGDRFESGDAACWDAAVGGPLGAGPCGPPRVERTEATYSSEGVLHHLHQTGLSARRDRYVVMLGERPVAVLTIEAGAGQVQYLTADHLGTPALATSGAGTTDWQGGLEPFGRDWREGTASAAQENGVVLRLPGQWDDAVWRDASSGASATFNVQRWYLPSIGGYSSTDPVDASHNDFAYVDARPTFLIDAQGLLALDPGTCRSFGALPGPSGAGWCLEALEQAVRQYNEFFTRGWRQRNPPCWKYLAAASWRPIRDQAVLSPLSCMVAGHRGELMRCDSQPQEPTDCGSTDPGDGSTFFNPLACNRAECGTTLNTLFHERLHRCGAPSDVFSSEARDIANVCVRGDAALQ